MTLVVVMRITVAMVIVVAVGRMAIVAVVSMAIVEAVVVKMAIVLAMLMPTRVSGIIISGVFAIRRGLSFQVVVLRPRRWRRRRHFVVLRQRPRR